MSNRKFQQGSHGRGASARREPIDLVHLFRMTVGDRRLQDEILDLFAQQIRLLMGNMRAAEPAALAILAHTLKGSARNIGAWELVEAAERIEAAVANDGDLAAGLDRLEGAGGRVQEAIMKMRQSEAGHQAAL